MESFAILPTFQAQILVCLIIGQVECASQSANCAILVLVEPCCLFATIRVGQEVTRGVGPVKLMAADELTTQGPLVILLLGYNLVSAPDAVELTA